jgi:hypothetical protein
MSKKLLAKLVLIAFILTPLSVNATATAWEIPEGLETIVGDDWSVWERVNEPGFDSDDNISVVAMAEYQEHLYAMTRNEASGAEVWRTNVLAGSRPPLWAATRRSITCGGD